MRAKMRASSMARQPRNHSMYAIIAMTSHSAIYKLMLRIYRRACARRQPGCG